MSDIDDIGYNSDEEINKKQHARLLDEVSQLDKRQHVKKPSRTEPTSHVSEFNLIKTNLGKKNRISLNDLTKSLKGKEKHVVITKKVKATFKERTLPKPLEKPQAERLRRSLGFNETKNHLNKWNSIVEKNRVASHLEFPLNQNEIHFQDEVQITKKPRYQSELDKELAKLEPQIETIVVEEKFPLNMEELIEQRKEMARLRARQSYQEAKAHKQKKIKSKKYHKIQRKQRLKEQIKEFEELQKTDPEAALQKLEQLEKTRVQERMSLRHRSTGQWAKNKQVRAKYDQESRQALAQQLRLSRDLTQKMKTDNSSDSEIEEDIIIKADESNPWTKQKSNEFTDFVSGYRKFWTEKNKINGEEIENKEEKEKTISSDVTNKEKANILENNLVNKNKEVVNKIALKKTKNRSKTQMIEQCKNLWQVTPTSDDENATILDSKNVEDLFENLQYKVQQKSNEKLTKLKELSQNLRKRKISLPVPKKSNTQKSDLVFKPERMRPQIDEEIGVDSESENEISDSVKNVETEEAIKTNKNKQDIDPNKYISVKPVELATKLPNIAVGDESEDEDQRAYISEAFADDDIIDEFSKDKKNTIDANTPKDIDLTLPGWGSWGGKNIQVSKRKKRRFIIKAPKNVPRKDENKGNLIINEDKDTKIKKHQVSEVPFPFTSVKDFEASIRAPIGDTFLPQTAFRRLIKPAVKTQKGAIIEPMSESILLKQKFSKQGRLVNK